MRLRWRPSCNAASVRSRSNTTTPASWPATFVPRRASRWTRRFSSTTGNPSNPITSLSASRRCSMPTVVELPVTAYKGPVDPDWCPGCGDFGVLRGLQRAAGKLGIQPTELMVVSGIGCSSNLPGYIHAYGFHGLHGRAVALATGMKLGNPNLHVVVTGGDGDGYGIGIGHFIHAMRRNMDLTYVVMDNQVYGLTTGQASPTTMKEMRTKSTPRGNVEMPINPIALALVSGATYVARGFSGVPEHMASLIAGG